MSDEACISLSKVSKNYRLYDSPLSKLKQLLLGGLKRYYVDFSALQDIDLEVKKGETVGIIGHNGAGKSTLLTLISRISAPTAGVVEVRGKIVSLLELGGGFNPDFTGRENVLLYGSLLGMSREEIGAKFDAIVAFAETGGFIEQPVRTYSSGMLMRLAFSVATQVDADILIFDELLAVGDGNFQYKCFRRLKELQDKGVTIILVSHNIDTITSLCPRVIILHRGKKYFDGGAKEGFWGYCRLSSLPQGVEPSVPLGNGLGSQPPMGTGEARFIKAGLFDDRGQQRSAFQPGECCEVKLTFVADKEIPHGSVGIVVQTHNALIAYGFNTISDPYAAFSCQAGVEQEAIIRLDLNLTPGTYYISVVLNRIDSGKVVSLCALQSFIEISITERLGVFGVSNLFATFKQGPADKQPHGE
jgi:ABC-type polysaccharide/polyol phosphate transport system ATPase subunit